MQDYTYIVIGLSLFVGFIIVFGIVCYCNRRVARNRRETNQTVEDVSAHRISVEDEIGLEKSGDAMVIKDASDDGQRNVYSDEPNQDLHVNFKENQETTLNTLERQNNYFKIDENECEDETDEEGYYESGLSDKECGYSTIDELSADDECSEEGIYHRIDDVYSVQHSSSEMSESDSVYAVIKDLFELSPKPNYYLSLYGGSEDEQSDLSDYHRISSLSEVESEASYTTIEEWELHQSTSNNLSVDEAGYLVITGSTDNIGLQISADAETNSEKNLTSLDRPNEENSIDHNLCTQNNQTA
ncbi:uncharacterized protein LOC117103626 isoform X2 [Anneissia japonica]|uniref:uncharacterized protein LOC117103626 isoform X2 n=1 Tax=Anneissia japonica TaxID=1529436 RepID=UPI0014258CA2|nr:uncharacterized protein LOC117103626 isoform X2 [Anneissia japonica]